MVMNEVFYAVIGGLVGGFVTAAIAALAAIRAWGRRGEQLAELRRTVEQLDQDGNDLEQRVRTIKSVLDQHIGEVRGHSLCTRSRAGSPDSEA